MGIMSRLDNHGYGLCRDWYEDMHGDIYVDQFYAFYCPDAAYPIRGQRALARDGKGTLLLDPTPEDLQGRQTIRTRMGDVSVSGLGMFLCSGTGQVVKCVEVEHAEKRSWSPLLRGGFPLFL